MYQAKRLFHSEFIPIRNLSYHVRCWGRPTPTKKILFMLHGWMDISASYQFVVDELSEDFYIVAPDWRGFGLTEVKGIDNFWFPDYLADLDFLIDHYSPGESVNLLGHSMGGNVAMLYSGIRSEKINRLINLEGFGMPSNNPSQAPERYGSRIDELKKLHQGKLSLRVYQSQKEVAERLIKTNPRLSKDKALWLAQHWGIQTSEDQWAILGHPAHKVPSANLSKVEETLACYELITAPVLMVEATDNSMSKWWKNRYELPEFHERIKVISNLTQVMVENAGHMLHHDQPAVLANHIERFLT